MGVGASRSPAARSLYPGRHLDGGSERGAEAEQEQPISQKPGPSASEFMGS
jgi:hypothetical protein